jgi:phosphonopyruvate decarboxylase
LNETTRDFLSCKDFYNKLKSHNIDFYTGVPDSLLKDYLSYIKNKNNYILPNEGMAVSFASGYHLATQKIPCVYLQNSGLGNTINPLMSLVHEKVYNIPMLLLVGWRGEPYKKDEPQHLAQGEVSEPILNSLGIKYSILPDHIEYAQFIIDESVEYIKKTNKPCVLLVKRQTFENYTSLKESNSNANIKRYSALKIIAEQLSDCKIVSTTGFTSRELYDIRKKQNNNFDNDFYVVGSMGHCSSIATGLAMYSDKKIVCIDGDGSALMHLGSMSTIGNLKPNNLIHILLNNNVHESVGGQTTNCSNTNFVDIAKGCGYANSYLVNNEKELIKLLEHIQKFEGTGPVFIEVKINTGTIESLGRPDNNFINVKKEFMD